MSDVTYILLGLCVLFAGVILLLLRSRNRNDDGGDAWSAAAGQLSAIQAEMQGRLAQLTQAQQTEAEALSRRLESRLEDVSRRLGDGLDKTSGNTQASLGQLNQRLVVINEAQARITELSSQVVSLQDLLANKQSRGAFGEVQLHDLITTILPPSAYRFQAVLSNNRRADCLLDLPDPPGKLVVDAKFPLESYHSLAESSDSQSKIQAERAFRTAILKHIRDIAARYIVRGETAESALMFLPSEAVYAELHARFPDLVQKSYRARVWIVSPTTLMATLNTMRAILRDVEIRSQAHAIQQHIHVLLDDMHRFEQRFDKLVSHFRQAEKDLSGVHVSAQKIVKHAHQIESVDLAGDGVPGPEPLKTGTWP